MQTVAIKDLQNNENIFITKSGNLIGVTIPLNNDFKNRLFLISLKKMIETTQLIEGYKKADNQTIQEVKRLRKKYDIKVSAKR